MVNAIVTDDKRVQLGNAMPPPFPENETIVSFSAIGEMSARADASDVTAHSAQVTLLEAFLLACWREGDVDMLRTLTNSLTGPGGLKLVWSDPLVDNQDE